MMQPHRRKMMVLDLNFIYMDLPPSTIIISEHSVIMQSHSRGSTESTFGRVFKTDMLSSFVTTLQADVCQGYVQSSRATWKITLLWRVVILLAV